MYLFGLTFSIKMLTTMAFDAVDGYFGIAIPLERSDTCLGKLITSLS